MIYEGLYQKTIFRNNKNGYTIFTLKLLEYDEQGRKMIICKGYIPKYATKTPLKVEGDFYTEKGKEAFYVSKVDISISNEKLLKSFILAHLGTGMGNVCADRFLSYLIIHNYTLEKFLQMDDAIEHLITIKGFDRKKAIAFLKKMDCSLMEIQLLNELCVYGISYVQVNKLYELYGREVRKEIKQNPYVSMKRAHISFNNIDAFARETGFFYCDSLRIRELVNRTYFCMAATGNSFLVYDDILSLFRKVEMDISCFDETIPEPLIMLELISSKVGYVDMSTGQPLFYTKLSWEAECSIVGNLTRLMNHKTEFLKSGQVTTYLDNTNNNLDDFQKQAFSLLETTSPAFLIGGPGTGKTTTVKEIVNCFKTTFPDKSIVMCAPTGRAAERIKEATGFDAMTIHMLLEFRMENGQSYPVRNENNPLEIDFLIIDEFSMVGIFLFSQLLRALPNHTKLLIIGDWNQLPSVEPGFLLHDLVNSNCFPYVVLKGLHRQSMNSSIHKNGTKILNGDISLEEDKNFIIHRFMNNAEAKMYMKEIYKKYYDKDLYDEFHVITPKRNGLIGVEELNLLAQELFHDSSEAHLCFGNNCFYVDDKVMTTRNCYDEAFPYYNGDLWVVNNFHGNEKIILCADNGKQCLDMEDENLEDLTLAYAMTIHKCQGSEGKVIVLVLPDDIPPVMITRSLLYTAVTRAAEKIEILTVGNALELFIQSNIHNPRNTGIMDKIKKSDLVPFC